MNSYDIVHCWCEQPLAAGVLPQYKGGKTHGLATHSMPGVISSSCRLPTKGCKMMDEREVLRI